MTKVNIPTILVIFGATGDLTKKKLAPALFHLYKKGKLPERFQVLGFARKEWSDDLFRGYLTGVLRGHKDIEYSDECRDFLKMFFYERGEFGTKGDYVSLKKTLERIDVKWGMCSNKLFYLAVMPELYKTIFKNLSLTHLNEPCDSGGGWLRIIVEKPFGKDLKTARELDIMLGKLFEEEQLYRIDHYLAKEMLQNILIFRFSNNLFEKNWSRETVESIDIKLWEKLGVEERGNFYDGVGALRDVGQNHLLQMLALVTMERPGNFGADAVRKKRAEILEKLKILSSGEVKDSSLRAQYDGYRTIQGVQPDSDTETYFRIRAHLDIPRWRGVAITMESGKRMHEQRKEIVIRFRHPSPCLCPAGTHYQNKVVIALEPEERITIRFWSKKPGHDFEMEERTFEFLFRPSFAKPVSPVYGVPAGKGQYVEEYEKLLLDCIFGEQTLFVSTEEVGAMWRFIDPIVEAWRKKAVPLKFYKPGTDEAVNLVKFVQEGGKKTDRTIKKEIGVVGLGKMGLNIALRLRDFHWKVAGFDLSPDARQAAKEKGIDVADSPEELFKKLESPRVVWLMVPAFAKASAGKPAGKSVDDLLFNKNVGQALVRAGFRPMLDALKKGDTIIDGGNSFYEDSVRRAKKLEKFGVNFLDVGVSGGPEGIKEGASLMIGGNKKIFERYEDLFSDLSVNGDFAYFGKSGAGHFVKMVHNGIEYGMMQAIAEGFGVMKKSSFRLELKRIAEVYNNGSVIESRLMNWLKNAYEEYGENLSRVSGSVNCTGEGEWTIKTAKKMKIKISVIEDSLKFRIRSKKKPSYAGKILTALRNQFGGHPIRSRSGRL